MKIKYNLTKYSLTNHNKKNFNIQIFNKYFSKKIYENTNYFILKKPELKKKKYKNIFNKDSSLIKDEYISINNNVFLKEKNFYEVLKFNIPGFKKKFLEFFERRSELLKEYSFENFDELSWNCFVFFFKKFFNFGCSLNLCFINISIMFLSKSYKGWRHLFNLPANGQRTWSNGKTLNIKKNVLTDNLYLYFKEGMPNAHPTEIKSSFQLEKYNLLWLNQWKPEWMLGNKRIQSDLKKTNKTYKFEANSLVKINPNFVKIKKKKVAPIGFEPGFTKFYLKEMKKYLKQPTPKKTT